ncbi:MAG: hypothetical protein ABI467_32505 [Kofleriaceae bacterium]
MRPIKAMTTIVMMTLVAAARTTIAAPDPAAPDPATPDPAAPDPAAPDPAAARASTPSPDWRFAPPSLAPVIATNAPIEPPPLDGGRLAGEAALGAGIGVVGFALGALAGAGLECAVGCDAEFGGLGGAIIGGAIGGVLGIGTGVYLGGNAGDQTGSFGASVGGALLGASVGGLVAAGLINGDHLDSAAAIVFVASPFAGALIGFNVTRRWDRPARAPAIGSLVRFDHGELRAGVPIVAPSATGGYLSVASGSF